MNYKKVIKDLKERNDKLQEQYILRDIRCIHLEYENEMLKSDFKAQHELTKKYAEENKELKELIDTILNWNIFKNECPMNFGYDEETNEDKAQDVFYKDDDYCENNCNDDYTKCWLKYFKRMQELEQGSDSNGNN